MRSIYPAPRNPMKAIKKKNADRIFQLSYHFALQKKENTIVYNHGTYNEYVDHYGTKDEVRSAMLKFRNKLIKFGFNERDYAIYLDAKLSIALHIEGVYAPNPFFDIEQAETFAYNMLAGNKDKYAIYVPYFVYMMHNKQEGRAIMYVKHDLALNELNDARLQAQKHFREVLCVERAANIHILY